MSDVHIDRLSLRLRGISRAQGRSIGTQVANQVATALQGKQFEAGSLKVQVQLSQRGMSEAQVVERVIDAILRRVEGSR